MTAVKTGGAYLVDGVRTPMGKYGGALASVRPDDLAAHVVRELVARAGVPAESSTRWSSVRPTRRARTTATSRGWRCCSPGCPSPCAGYTVNRLCASGLTAVVSAAHAIRSGEADVDRRRRRRVDDPRAVGDGQAGHPVGQPGRGVRHLDRLAVHQPATSSRTTATPTRRSRCRWARPPKRSPRSTASAAPSATRSPRAATNAPSPRSTPGASSRDRAGAGARRRGGHRRDRRAAAPTRQAGQAAPGVPRRRHRHRRVVVEARRRCRRAAGRQRRGGGRGTA